MHPKRVLKDGTEGNPSIQLRHVPNPSKQGSIRSRLTHVPHVPGVYRWLDRTGKVLYVGKAKDLHTRMKSYFQKTTETGPWRQALLDKVCDFLFTITRTELEALLLETNLIKELQPSFNVLMKDDKNYVYVKVTVESSYPTIDIVRRIDDRRAKYFGPFLSKREVEKSLEMLHEFFRFRACTASLNALNAGKKPLRECVEYQIGRCNGLCAGHTSQEEYRRAVEEVMHFFRGDSGHVLRKAKELMQQVVCERKFERAARLRDMIHSLEVVKEKQVVSHTSHEDMDVIGIALATRRVQAVIFRVRGGKIVSEQALSLRGSAEYIGDAIEQFLPQYLEYAPDTGSTILIGEDFAGRTVCEEFLQTRQEKAVRILVPERGRKHHLLELAEHNAQEKLRVQEEAWEADRRNTEEALRALQSVLGLPSIPQRIEGFDISHLGGTETVGSMVVFHHGKAVPDQYRSFTIRTMKEGIIDDYAAVREVLKRRLRYLGDALHQLLHTWEDKGVVIRRARRGDTVGIESLIKANPQNLSSDDLDKGVFFVAVRHSTVIGCCRLYTHTTGLQEVRSVCVAGEERGHRLGQLLVRVLLSRQKRKKVYIVIDPALESYYSEIGFRHVLKVPPVLEQKIHVLLTEDSHLQPPVVMLYDVQKNTLDPSLSVCPDLVVVDGGKGQLRAALDVVSDMKLTIPVVALAKKNEELFVPGQGNPLEIIQDSPARFLLMRLRDEAHRRAHTHQELRRGKRMMRG